jgi:structural maintenance of chromosome 3 (chondroitin sulfate proteoglycan 6)
MDGLTSKGLASVRRYVHQEIIPGCYGTIAELITVHDRYRTAVETAAGASLFHYVVEDSSIARRLVLKLREQKGGRVTFVPLAQTTSKPSKAPQAGDALPIMEKIGFDPKFQKALEHIFGNTIIVQTLAIGGQYARSHGVHGVTLDGEQCHKRGAWTGGYEPHHISRLEAVANVQKSRDEYEGHKTRLSEVQREIERKDQEITRSMGELQKADQKRQQLENSYRPMHSELRGKTAQLEKIRDSLDTKSRARDAVDANLKTLGEQLSAYETELSSEFKKALTRDEERQLENLSSSVQDLRKNYTKLSTARSELEGQKAILEVELRQNLRLRLDQLKGQEFEATAAGGSSNLKEAQRELKRITKAGQTVDHKLRKNEDAIDQMTIQLAELEQSKSEKQKEQEEIARAIERHQKRMDKSIAKKALLMEKAAECSRNLRDLGVLPEGAFERFEKSSSVQVCICPTVGTTS